MIKGVLCVAAVLLVGCTRKQFVLQLYGVDSYRDLSQQVEVFAAEHQMHIERPDASPAIADAAVTIVYGSQWRSALLARELADVLRAGGTDVNIRPTRLQNHVVTSRYISVFVRDPSIADAQPEEDMDDVSQLICSPREDAEAIILLFADGTMEIHNVSLARRCRHGT